MNEITKELIDSADSEYREFSSKLIPNVDKETVLGVRAPICKAIAKKFTGTHEGDSFLLELPHKYHDENIVHGYMLGMIGTREQIENFLPHMNSWAVVDTTVAGLKKFFKKHRKMERFTFQSMQPID